MDELVSIIMPAYNSERYIKETIESVLKQTYKNFELIIVDDNSSDNTYEVIDKFSKIDNRIKKFKLSNNFGAAKARNLALKNSKGRFIAYLDADDIWYDEKIEKQVKFMLDNNYGFSCTSYEVIDDSGKSLNKFIIMAEELDYKGFLINNLIQTVGVIVDTQIVSRELLKMPNMRRRQDAATWLQVLKQGYSCYGMNNILAKYRRTKGSLSSNKFKAVKGMWYLYRKVEHLSLAFSSYCFIRYAFLAVKKRIYLNKNK